MERIQRIIAYGASLGATLLAFALIGSLGGGYMSGPITMLITILLAPFVAVVTAFWHPAGTRYLNLVRDGAARFPPPAVWGRIMGVALLACVPVFFVFSPDVAVILLASLLIGAVAYVLVVHSIAVSEGR